VVENEELVKPCSEEEVHWVVF
jgi:hypothetical protein